MTISRHCEESRSDKVASTMTKQSPAYKMRTLYSGICLQVTGLFLFNTFIYFDRMKPRPLSITLISYLFMAAGAMGVIYHASELKEIFTRPEEGWVLFVRILAIVGGAFTLRGANWARWLLLAWIIYHVFLSFSHSTAELVMHAGLTVIVGIALFNPKANVYFQKNSKSNS
jgi:hypothetical protein